MSNIFAKIWLLHLLVLTGTCHATSWNDISRLNQEDVGQVISVTAEIQVIQAIRDATANKQKIAISGTKHSQGGHIVYPGAILLDMTPFNRIVDFSPNNKTIRVQSGATWADIQTAINPHNLSIKVMQSSNIFTVGGSLSANAHGRDPNYGPIIETVNGLKLALASGETVNASRTENSDLFYAVIGGYGSIAIILEAEIALTDNLIFSKSVVAVDYRDYPTLLSNGHKMNPLHFGRCAIAKGGTLLRECFSIDYTAHSPIDHAEQGTTLPVPLDLQNEKNISLNAFFFNRSRHSNTGKKLRWYLQKTFIDRPEKTTLITRNNAMRPPIKFLEYHGKKDTDILQEYFIPHHHFVGFVDKLRTVVETHDVNLLSVTLRHVKGNNDAVLSYAPNDAIAVVLYINIGLDTASIEKAKIWTRALVDITHQYKGRYYLAYQRFPSTIQFNSIYPNAKKFHEIKQRYDKNDVFYNRFYEAYIALSVKSETK